MYINRALLFMLGFAFIFYPSIEAWLLNGDTDWHRPYQVWLLIIVAAYWNQRTREPDEL
ncbi:MAG: hypothetical protein V7754_04070 [Halioglobus sp.]